MSSKPVSIIRRGFGMFWTALDATRRTLFNLLFLLIIILIVVAMVTGGPKPIAAKTALVLDLKGDLVEQRAGTPADQIMANVTGGDAPRAVQLRDVLKVLDSASKDPNIGSVVLMLDQLGGAAPAMTNEVGAAIDRVKAAGKPVIAWGANFDQRQYKIASHASEVYVHPMGMVLIEGYGRRKNYYRDALDKLGVKVNLIKVGTYKSYAEQYTSTGPSPAATEAEAYLYDALWAGYTSEVEKSRKLAAGSIMGMIDNFPKLLEATKGDMAQLALQAKLVDGLKTRDEIREMMIKRGVKDEDKKTFRQVSYNDYLMRHRPVMFGDGVGVVVAAGEISDGTAGPGAIGGISTSNLIRKAREDDAIKAIVLRVDSPGGSAFASELIRRELELTRAAGKPVVVSMGSVAASGGYWIAMSADEVIADRSTVTGSIGVFALIPTADKVAEKIGVSTGGHTTTWLADAYNPLRALDPRFEQLIQLNISRIYSDFTTKAALARKTTPEKIDAVAQGRVWTGMQAKERGLVDTIGSYGDAIKSAAKRAKLPEGYRVAYIEREGSTFERFLEMFGATSAQAINIQVKLGMLPTGLPKSAVNEVTKDLTWLSDLDTRRTSFQAITHCLCDFK